MLPRHVPDSFLVHMRRESYHRLWTRLRGSGHVKHKKGCASLSDFKVGEEEKLLYRQDGTNIVCNSLWQPGSNPAEKKHKIQKQQQQ